eukprot:605630-Amorphochlora_amoeboformis.AAC.1
MLQVGREQHFYQCMPSAPYDQFLFFILEQRFSGGDGGRTGRVENAGNVLAFTMVLPNLGEKRVLHLSPFCAKTIPFDFNRRNFETGGIVEVVVGLSESPLFMFPLKESVKFDASYAVGS